MTSINQMKHEHDELTQRILGLQSEINASQQRRSTLQSDAATPESLAEMHNLKRIIDANSSQLPILNHEKSQLYVKINSAALNLNNFKVGLKEVEGKLKPYGYYDRMVSEAENKLNMVNMARNQAKDELLKINKIINELEGE